jgi:hypothetical protein
VCAKLYDRKTPITAADLLNDRVLPLLEQHEVKLLRVLTDRGSEYRGNPERLRRRNDRRLITSHKLPDRSTRHRLGSG